MVAFLQLVLIALSGLVIAVADALIKKVSVSSFWQAFVSPWMIAVYVLYFVQIVFAILVFIFHKELGVYSNFFLVFYSLASIGLGYFFFKEHLSLIQYVGIAFALVGVFLMNKQ